MEVLEQKMLRYHLISSPPQVPVSSNNVIPEGRSHNLLSSGYDLFHCMRVRQLQGDTLVYSAHVQLGLNSALPGGILRGPGAAAPHRGRPGSGKTLIAEYAIERALAAGERVVYTAPIKASPTRSSGFSARWGDRWASSRGVAIRPDAPLLHHDHGDLPQLHLRGRTPQDVRWCVFDEIHFIDDAERASGESDLRPRHPLVA